MGFNKTQALIAFSENTPNNTFGIFWKYTERNNPLFPRKDSKQSSVEEMREDKKARKEANYGNNGKEIKMDEYIVSLVLNYFKIVDKKYELRVLRRLMGFMQKKMEDILDYLIDNKYLAYVDFRLKLTQKGLIYLISRNKFDNVLRSEEYQVDKKKLNKFYLPPKS